MSALPGTWAIRRKRFNVRVWWPLRRAMLSRHGLPVGGNGSMMPEFGKGRFVSVEQHGPFLDLHDEKSGDTIRLVPYQPNHGVMVEVEKRVCQRFVLRGSVPR